MKIALVIYGSLDTVSGGYIYDRMVVEHLRSRGDTVEVISLPQRNYAVRLSDNLSFRLPGAFDILLEDELAHPSLLRANNGRHSAPIISIVHNLHSSARRSPWKNSIYRGIERQYLRSVDGFIFNSGETCAAVGRLLPVMRLHVIAPPGGDRLGVLEPSDVKARAHESGPLRLLFLANVTSGKGLEVLLDALALLPHGQYSLDVAGSCDVEPSYAKRLRRKSADLGLTVKFRGTLGRDALVGQLRRAQALVVPSFYEGFGIAFLEGMAFGLPGIGTTAGAIPQLISDGKNGYLIRPGDCRGLADRLAEMALNRPLLAELGCAALQSFRQSITWKESAALIRSFLLGVIEDWGSPQRERQA